ncbi:hypothetical protein [Enterococcus cecorum]|uniref:hypothetical protein n=1 Tax=Enterococcus cecorum TaxID=44008 RepID=UPI003F232E12
MRNKISKIQIYKNFSVNILFLLMFFTMFSGFFITNFDVPASILYFEDVINIALILLNIKKMTKKINTRELRFIFLTLLFLFVILFFIGMIRDSSIIRAVWALRNWGRLFSFFFICITVLNEKMVERFINFIMIFFHINVLFIILQFMTKMVNSQDELNGFFGRDTSSINITMTIIISIIIISQYFTKKCTIGKLVLYSLEIFIVSILAELKAVILFWLILLLLIGFVNIRNSTKRMIKYIAIGLVMIVLSWIASMQLVKLYPEFSNFLSISKILESTTTKGGYGHSGYIDRLTSIQIINQYFFNFYGISYKLFGIGLGNGEYSTVASLVGPFYETYGATFGYLNFSSAIIYLESGIVGLTLYSVVFIRIIYERLLNICVRGYINADREYFESIGLGVAVICLIFIVYNNLLRTDASYLLAFFLAIPFIYNVEENNL